MHPINAVLVGLCGASILGTLIVLGFPKRLDRLQHALAKGPAITYAIVAALLALYIIPSLALTARPSLFQFGVMTVYLSVPFLLLYGARDRSSVTLHDAAAILWVWLPVELGILRRLLIGDSAQASIQWAFVQALAITMGVIAFAAWRRFPQIGYRYEFDRKSVETALVAFLLFAAVSIPLGLQIRFIAYSVDSSALAWAPITFLGIFFLIAVPEELLFRGLIQNGLEHTTGSRTMSLALASVIFGAAHLNNGPTLPNYRYALMAAVAGAFYGWVWQRTGRVTVSGLTHALVNTAWGVFFRGAA